MNFESIYTNNKYSYNKPPTSNHLGLDDFMYSSRYRLLSRGLLRWIRMRILIVDSDSLR